MNHALALTNTCLIAASIWLIVSGIRCIRRREIQRHRSRMLAAFALQALFLVVFVTRFVRYGLTELRVGWIPSWLFQAVLISHEALAVVTVPLVVSAVALGLLGKEYEHREVAKMTLPIWLYVSVTGILLYAALYAVA